MRYSGDSEFGIQDKQSRKIAGNFGQKTILGILFDIFSMEYRVKPNGILMRISNRYKKLRYGLIITRILSVKFSLKPPGGKRVTRTQTIALILIP